MKHMRRISAGLPACAAILSAEQRAALLENLSEGLSSTLTYLNNLPPKEQKAVYRPAP
ncbi:MAG: hypothetical protein KJ052_13400 [Candidatus Hydrogenedentes bacterium]|nr:hypothetical protein [Candidatus Hydrogenedentota bacterium]